MYTPSQTSQFKKDIKKAKKDPQKNMTDLKLVIDSLLSGKSLDKKYRDHSLVGNYKGHRECHISPDWLLIYYINEKEKEMVLVRTGSHSYLF